MTSRDNQLTEDQVQLAAGRDLANWATAVRTLHVSEVPDGVDNINVDGRRVVGVIQGFGQLWRKTYRIRLDGAAVTPAEVIAVWKQRFASFWPADSRFHSPQGGLAPGVVVLLDQLLPGHLRLSSGVMILYADEVSFTVMTAEGHPLAGWNTFSAFEEDGVTVAEVQVLMRADDPLFELGMVLFAHRMEDRLWQQTLHNLAADFGVQAPVKYQRVRLDRRRSGPRPGMSGTTPRSARRSTPWPPSFGPGGPRAPPSDTAKAQPVPSPIGSGLVGCGVGAHLGVWTAGHQRSTTDCCELMEFQVDLASSQGSALLNNLLLISHGRDHELIRSGSRARRIRGRWSKPQRDLGATSASATASTSR
jgi:hypothetical protein